MKKNQLNDEESMRERGGEERKRTALEEQRLSVSEASKKDKDREESKRTTLKEQHLHLDEESNRVRDSHVPGDDESVGSKFIKVAKNENDDPIKKKQISAHERTENLELSKMSLGFPRLLSVDLVKKDKNMSDLIDAFKKHNTAQESDYAVTEKSSTASIRAKLEHFPFVEESMRERGREEKKRTALEEQRLSVAEASKKDREREERKRTTLEEQCLTLEKQLLRLDEESNRVRDREQRIRKILEEQRLTLEQRLRVAEKSMKAIEIMLYLLGAFFFVHCVLKWK